MKLILLLIYFGLMVYASYKDIKYREVDDKISLALYLIALIIAILDKLSIWQIILWTLSIFIIFYLAELIYQFARRKSGHYTDDMHGIGGADIKISASLGLVVREYGLIYMIISLGLALIISRLILKDRVMPLIPYFTAGLFVIGLLMI